MRAVCVILFLVTAATSVPTGNSRHGPAATCGYQSCPAPKPGMLNVHLVPHTHDDVGWLKTVDQYYYGSRSEIQKAGVQYILDSVIQELVHDPDKKFIYVETAFLWKWWMQQHDSVKHQVRQLVNSGQLELVSGGWTMNDEAVTHYQSTIDQMTWGLRKLNDTFGTCGRPRVGWQIDPFGHSREQASLFANMGYDGTFLGRLDYQDKNKRFINKQAEMVWQGSPENIGSRSDLFTHVLFNGYSPPPGFCFDVLCDDEPIIDRKKSAAYNVPTKVHHFLSFVASQSQYYQSSNIILTMGGDFTYQAAGMTYNNLDKLIRHVNAEQKNGSRVNAFYSTPSCYLQAVHDTNKTWPSKSDDFFPYASDPHTYWTGYFTSKPTIKRFERVGNQFLQTCKQLYALADLGPEDRADLDALREAVAILQHHDAVTGTEKDHVAHDYARILTAAMDEGGIAANAALNKLMSKPADPTPSPVTLESCLLLNISSCPVSEWSHAFVVSVYNPLGHAVSHHVRLPVTSPSYIVRDNTGKEVPVQLVPIPDAIQEASIGRTGKATLELVFRAADIPALGFRSYHIVRSNRIVRRDMDSVEVQSDGSSLGNQHVSVTLSPEGAVVGLRTGRTSVPLEQTFGFYRGSSGDNSQSEHRASGAYIFRPNGTHPEALPIQSSKVYKGALVDEVHQTFSPYVSQVVRVYHAENHVEFQWLVGPIPKGELEGKEVISRFTTPLKTNGTFYTDSNGREMIRRVRDSRPTWPVKLVETVAGNYYPVTSKISIQDDAAKIELAVLPDRAQGGTSLSDGEIELMVHRRLFFDDGFGVDEALDEQQFGHGLVARGTHYVVGGDLAGIRARHRGLALRKHLQPWIFLTKAEDSTYEQWSQKYNMEFSGLSQDLPKNVHLLTFEPWKGRSFLLRLEHFLEKSDDAILSKPATVDVTNMFSGFLVKSGRETMLGANQWREDSDRFQWRRESNEVEPNAEPVGTEPLDLTHVVLNPMEIRTFVVEIGPR